MKRMAFILFLINTFFLTGCSPQNRQASEEESVTGENSSDSANQTANQQIPACDADETKNIVKDIIIEKYKMSVPSCYNQKLNTLRYFATAPAINNSCEQIVSPLISVYETTIGNWRRLNSGYVPQSALDDLENAQLENWAYVDDFVTTFDSYLVKSEVRAPDGNSSYCDLRVAASGTSAKTGIQLVGIINVNLTLYKKDQKKSKAL